MLQNAARSLKTKAVFLDRDGTINREVDVLRSVSQLRILPGVPRAIGALNRLGYLVIVVTNQPVVARGWLSEKQVENIHRVLVWRLARQGARVDAIFYCPHHPNANVKKYRLRCRCRKPKPGMITAAIKTYRIDRQKSFMVGDHAWDIMAGKAARLRTILVHTSKRSRDPVYAHIRPDFEAKHLRDAVTTIKKHAKK